MGSLMVMVLGLYVHFEPSYEQKFPSVTDKNTNKVTDRRLNLLFLIVKELKEFDFIRRIAHSTTIGDLTIFVCQFVLSLLNILFSFPSRLKSLVNSATSSGSSDRLKLCGSTFRYYLLYLLFS